MMIRHSSVAGQRVARQTGRTLIELLIAMLLSLIIIGAVGVLYDVTSRTSRVSQQLGNTEEQGRLALFHLAEPIAMAGSGTVTTNAGRFQANTFVRPHLRGCANGRFENVAAGDFDCVATALPGDALFVAFQAQSLTGFAPQTAALDDCLGQDAVDVGGGLLVVENAYSITLASGVPQLACLGNGGGATHGLVRNVEDFKVYFAMDMDAWMRELGQAHTLRPSTLMTGTQISLLPGAAEGAGSALNPWNYVVSVHVCLLLGTAESGVTPDGNSTFTPCPQTVAEALDPSSIAQQTLTDGIARRSYSQVFTVRSRAQAQAGSVPM